MSQTIDNRVVQLEFDNSGFEENAQESLSTLQKLKQSLKLDEAAKNLTALGAAASKFTMGGISTACEEVADRFSYMKYVGLVALSNLVTGAMQAGSRIANALIGPITSGGWNRAMNLEQANFMMHGLLETEEDIEAVMKNVNEAVDGTAYSLDAAAKVAAQFTASGMKAGDSMEIALKAIAGTAAMTNSSFEEIGDIFTTVEGQGKLMTYQMNQLSFRGLNTAATLGKVLNKTEEEIRDMVSKGKIDFETFSQAMYDAFGEHAKEANSTFTGALANVKSALGRIGAEFATPFIRDIIPVLNSFRLAINATKTVLTPFFETFDNITSYLSKVISKNIDSYTENINKFAGGIRLVFSDVIKTITNLYEIVKGIIAPIKEAYKEIFPDKNTLLILKNLSNTLVDVTKKLKTLYFESGAADTIKLAFKGFFSIFDTGKVIISRIIDLIKQFAPIFDGFGGTINKVITKVSEFLLGVNDSIKNSDFLVWDLSNVVSKIQEIGNWIRTVFDQAREKIEGITPKLQSIKDFVGSIFLAVKEYFSKVIQGVKDIAGKDIFKTVADHIKNGFSGLVTGISNLINKVLSTLSNFKPSLDAIFDAITRGIAAVLKGILNGISGFLDSKEMSNLVSTLKNGAIIRAFWEFAKSMGSLNDVIINLSPKRLLESFTGISSLMGDANLIESLAKSILKLAAAMFILSIIDVDRFNAALDAMKTMFVSIGVILAMLKLLVPVINTTGSMLSKLIKTFTWSNIIPDGTIGLGMEIAAIATGVLLLAFALKTLSSVDPGKLIASTIAIGALMAMLTTAIVIFAREVSKMTSTLTICGAGYKQFKKIASGLSRLIMSLVLSILGLVAAVKILSNIPFTSLVKSLGALTIILAEMAGFCYILSKLDIDKTVGPALLKISIGLIAIAAALKIMASIPSDQMVVALKGLREGMATITIALLALAGAMLIFSKLKLEGPNFKKLASSLLIVSISLIALSASLKILSTIDPIGMSTAINLLAVGMIAMTGSLLILAFAAAALEKNMSILRKVNMPAIAASMLILSVALIAMSLAMTILSTIKMDTFDLLVIFAGGLFSMVGALWALAQVPSGDLLKAAAALTIVSVAMIALSASLAVLAVFPFEKLAGALLILVGAVLSLTLIAGVLSDTSLEIVFGALAILAVMTAIDAGIALFGVALGLVGKSMITIGEGLAKIGVGVTIVAGAIAESLTETFSKLSKDLKQIKEVIRSLAFMGALSPLILILGVALLSVGAGLTLIGTGITVFAKGLQMLSVFMVTFANSLKLTGNILTHSKKEMSAFIGLILKLALLAIVAPLLVIFAVGLLAVGAALFVFGAGLTMVTSGLALFAIAMEKLSQVDWAAIGQVIAAIFEAVKNAILGIIDFIRNIDWAAVWDTIKQAAIKLIDWFKNYDWAGLWNKIKEAFAKFSLWLITKLANILVALSQKLHEIGEAIKTKLSEMWEGLKETISQKWAELKKTISDKWFEILQKFDGFVSDIKEKGRHILDGFLEGLSEGWDNLTSWPSKVKDAILGGLDTGFDMNSPSKETWYRGLFVSEGFNNGLSEGAQETDSIVDGIVDNTLGKLGGVGTKIRQVLGVDVKEAADVAEDSLSNLLTTVVDHTNFTWQESVPALEETWEKLGSLVTQLEDVKSGYESGQISVTDYERISKSLQDQIIACIGSFEDLEEAQDAIKIKISALKKEQKDLTTAFESHAISQKECATRYKENANAIRTLTQIQEACTKQTSKAKKKTDEQSEALNKNTNSTNTNTSSKKSATKANEDFAASLEKTLTNQLDIFKKFEAKNPMNKTELLENMRSQIKGMTDWAGQMAKLATMGIDQGLYKKLAEMGPQGAEYVGAFASMTAEELAQANELWAQSLVLPGNVANSLQAQWGQLGDWIPKGWANGIAGNQDEAVQAVTDMQKATYDAAHDGIWDFGSPSHTAWMMGFWIDLGLGHGVLENMHFAIKAIETMCNLMVDKAKRLLDPDAVFKPIGADAVLGLKQGIESEMDSVTALMEELGHKLTEAIKSKKALDEASPSHAMEEVGEFAVLGLARGINNKSDIAVKSMEDMGADTIAAMKYTVANIAAMINDEIEDPVIRPVLDLSNVQAGVRTLNSVFSTNQALSAGTALQNLQNGQSTSGNVQFIQNNYSPKALSRVDIYRQTRNQLAQIKQVTG